MEELSLDACELYQLLEKGYLHVFETDSEATEIGSTLDRLSFFRFQNGNDDSYFFNNIVPNLRFLRSEVDVLKEKIGVVPQSGENQKNKKVFPCAAGTMWNQIVITLISNEMVKIDTPNGSRKFTYHQLDMADKRSGDKPTLIWQILKLFAQFNGRLDSTIPESVKRILLNDFNIDCYKKLPDYTKRLDEHLQKFFGIKDRIFKYDYRKYKAYITKIVFSDSRHPEKTGLDGSPKKSLHDFDTEDIQDKLGITDSKRIEF